MHPVCIPAWREKPLGSAAGQRLQIPGFRILKRTPRGTCGLTTPIGRPRAGCRTLRSSGRSCRRFSSQFFAANGKNPQARTSPAAKVDASPNRQPSEIWFRKVGGQVELVELIPSIPRWASSLDDALKPRVFGFWIRTAVRGVKNRASGERDR